MALIEYNSTNMSQKIADVQTVRRNFEAACAKIEEAKKAIQENWTGTDAELAKPDFNTITTNLTQISNNIKTIEMALLKVQSNMAANKYQ